MSAIDTLQARAAEVADWLETLPRTYAAPCVVTIGRASFAGATYTQVRDTHEGTAAYASGERTHSVTAMYLLGELPAAYRRTRCVRFRIAGSRFPWYVGGWYPDDAPNTCHPFGRMFLLFLDRSDVTTRDDGTPYDETPLRMVG